MTKKNLFSICDEKQYEILYNTYYNSLCDFLTYKFGSQYNPQDTVQDVFIKLWQNCNKVDIQKVKSYLFTSVNNTTINKIKHQKIVLNFEKTKPKAYTTESPEFILEKDEFMIQYEIALSSLPEEQRVAFLLNKAEGLSHKEIAEKIGVTRKVVEYRIYTAFKSLKSKLENFNIK